jgi:hypothetical protein
MKHYQTTGKFIGCGPVPISLTVVLSVLRYTDSDYPFGIFKLFLFTNGDCVSKSVTECPSMEINIGHLKAYSFFLSLVRSVAYGEKEVKLFACKEIINQW